MKKNHYMKILGWGALILIGLGALAAGGYIVNEKVITKNKGGELIKMLGMKNSDPKDYSSYHANKGVIYIQHWKTSQGVPVYFVEVPTLSIVDIEVAFDAGAARDKEKGGVAYLTNMLFSEGTEKLSADQVAENFDAVGAQFSAASQRDMAALSLRTLSDPKLLLPAVETLTDILSHPVFPDAGFQRKRQSMITSLKGQMQDPAQVASRAFYSKIYPEQPYGNWVLGSEKTLNALTTEDVKSFYKEFYVANNAIVAIVGNLSAAEANAIAEKITKALPAGNKAPDFPAVKSLVKTPAQHIDFPSLQTHIMIGQPLIKYGDPDYYAFYLGNHILGGNGSVTRLYSTVRSQHGLAYSVYSKFQPMRAEGPYIWGCQTRTQEAEKALDLLQTLVKEYVEKGPTEKEVQEAKLNLLGGYALNFDSNALILQQIAMLGFYGLPLDYFDRFKGEIEKLTPQDIQKVFQKRVFPDNAAIVTVGKAVEAQK